MLCSKTHKDPSQGSGHVSMGREKVQRMPCCVIQHTFMFIHRPVISLLTARGKAVPETTFNHILRPIRHIQGHRIRPYLVRLENVFVVKSGQLHGQDDLAVHVNPE